jgi:glucose-1-phosphate adenylyltransferase
VITPGGTLLSNVSYYVTRRINRRREVEYSILMPNLEVPAIAASAAPSSCICPESTVIGYDLEQDRARGYAITDCGIVVVAQSETMAPIDPPLSRDLGGGRRPHFPSWQCDSRGELGVPLRHY